MNFLEDIYTEWQVYEWEIILDDYIFLAAMGLFLLELVRYTIKKTPLWDVIKDSFANFVTLSFFLLTGFLIAGAYVTTYYIAYEYFSLTYVPINLWTIAACIVLADIAYYWEHRVMHRMGIGWATHTVHHSSPHFNISVAYRFGPLDALFGLPFHLPLALLGFNPVVIFFAAAFVQLYQTLLHTEAVGKLPRFIEAIMNTPSHHRVHHGSNPQYIDKNYAGIFIIWDKLFGTFAKEEEKVVYGITRPINTNNPFKVYTLGLIDLAKKMNRVKGLGNKMACIVMPPEWMPAKGRKDS